MDREMLWHASAINGYAIEASDGDIGTVSDFLFDDASWQVRWLVVDTGNWLSGRKVLLPPSALGRIDAKDSVFAVKLTKQQVKDSPEIDTDRPVSRQMENSVYDYYGWSPYWGSGFYMGDLLLTMPGSGMASPYLGARHREQEIANAEQHHGDVHLRSVEAVTGYHIHASDGEIGHVEDFLVDDADWSIHYLIVDTKNWWPGKKVLVSSRSAGEIDWMDRLVNLDVDRQRIKDSPAYDPTIAIDRAYDEKLLTYYGIKFAAA
jgi:sporulation protein YlmC with PRC-barrel domain